MALIAEVEAFYNDLFTAIVSYYERYGEKPKLVSVNPETYRMLLRDWPTWCVGPNLENQTLIGIPYKVLPQLEPFLLKRERDETYRSFPSVPARCSDDPVR